MHDLVVVGAGAAGYFGAIAAAEAALGMGMPPLKVCILEQGRHTLSKVRVSGGGRCNLTHAEFDAKLFARHYPRGRRELLGPLTRFGSGDTMAWFEDRGLPLKIEGDGRVFPVSDDSGSVVEVLERRAAKLGIEVRLASRVTALKPDAAGRGHWDLDTAAERLSAKLVLLATGSTPSVYKLLAAQGVPIVDPVPSLFSFNLPKTSLTELQGLSMPDAVLTLDDLPYRTQGSLLITHWGLSGPAALRMSAEAALELHRVNYRTQLKVSWLGSGFAETREYLMHARSQSPKATLRSDLALGLPKRLWGYLVARAGGAPDERWADLNSARLGSLARVLSEDTYRVEGQTRFKEEFVTAGGIELSAIDFRTFALRTHPGLYAAGELLNIDGITGGFNFQAAWTGGYLAGQAIATQLASRG